MRDSVLVVVGFSILLLIGGAAAAATVSVDGDSLSVGAELIAYDSAPFNADTDADGLQDGEELVYETDPTVADTDNDTLLDATEINQGTNPLEKDTDSDGLSDSEELEYKTKPTLADTDDDGLQDGVEVNTYGTAPTLPDTDLDGLTDYEETRPDVRSSPTRPDTDNDGLDDMEEQTFGTDPADADTDNDMLPDGPEVKSNTRLSGADPLQKDIFVEVDSMDGATLSQREQYRLQEAFDDAPVRNPDGTRGISLHLNVSDTNITTTTETTPSEYYERYKPRYFENDGYGYYHILIVNDASGDTETTETVGYTRTGTNGAVVQYQTSKDGTGTTTMHELGHQLGLSSNDYRGIDGQEISSDSYVSIMNYNYYPCFGCDPYTYSSSEPFDDWEHINQTWPNPGTYRLGTPTISV